MTSIQQEAQQSKLLERFGKTVLKDGYTAIPNTLLKRQAELGINPTQLTIIVQIWMTWWSRFPCPPIPLIARRIKRGVRCVQRNLHALSSPIIDSHTDEETGEVREVTQRPALLIIRPRRSTNGTPLANEYDFSPLLALLEYLETHQEETPDEDEGMNLDSVVSNRHRNGGSDDGVVVSNRHRNGGSDDGVVVSFEHESTLPSNLEESRQESFLDRDTSSLRKEPSKGSVFENVDNLVDEGTRGSNNGYDGDGEEAWYQPPPPHRAHNEQARTPTQPGEDTVENRNPRNQGAEEAAAPSNLPGWATPDGEQEKRYRRVKLPQYLETQLKDFSAEFHDEHPASSRTRLARLYEAAGVDTYWFGEIIYEARAITKKARVNKTKEFMTQGGGVVLRTNSMPYFFSVLRDLLREKGLIEEGGQP